jgi:hypothetical protein
MDYNILYNIEKKNLEFIIPEEILDKIYLLEYKVPNINELKSNDKNINKIIDNNKNIIDDIKNYISNLEYKMPLFDIYTNNIYLINKENIFKRVTYNFYRFPNTFLLNDLEKEYNHLKNTIDNTIENIIEKRKVRKYELIIDFMKNFNIKVLEDTYYRMIYKYSEELGKNIIFCKRPSFNKYIHNTTPYYTSTEIINLALNMGMNIKIDDKLNLEELCIKVKENDINYKIISSHQKYVIDTDKLGLCQYYTVRGSYNINSYLRNMTNYFEQNIFLDEIIKPMWELCNNAPAFDKDYIVYRFIKNDNHLSHLKIGDIYQDEGFLSTTRDPFYKSNEYQFGFILMKIKIPKNIKGVALCIESVSHFPEEQEILFSPKSKLKLISRDKNTIYYHTDPNFSSDVKTKYEFEWVGSEEPKINKPIFKDEIKTIDFLKIKSFSNDNLNNKINYFVENYCDKMNRFNCIIGNNKFLTCFEKYNSIGAYKNFYAMETQNGNSFYSIYKNYLLFFIELGETDRGYEMHVNYYVKYNTLNKEEIYNTEDFINFLSSLAYYFNIESVAIYPEYKPCFISKKNINQYTGNYCVDFYKYLKNNEKKFFVKNINTIELNSVFDYYDLDLLKELDVLKIINKHDDELYQLYIKYYFIEFPDNKLADFFIWIIENKCYLIESLINKLNRLYKDKNPFTNDLYILNSYLYLYNRGIVKIYGGSNFDINYKKKKSYYLQTNEYRGRFNR